MRASWAPAGWFRCLRCSPSIIYHPLIVLTNTVFDSRSTTTTAAVWSRVLSQLDCNRFSLLLLCRAIHGASIICLFLSCRPASHDKATRFPAIIVRVFLAHTSRIAPSLYTNHPLIRIHTSHGDLVSQVLVSYSCIAVFRRSSRLCIVSVL